MNNRISSLYNAIPEIAVRTQLEKNNGKNVVTKLNAKGLGENTNREIE